MLRSYPWREADRQYSAFTPQYGKIEFTGRGALKGKAKLASHLEPFGVIEIEIIKGKSSTTVISVDRKELFPHIMYSIERRVLAHASLFFVDRYTYTDSEEPALYEELHAWLAFLNQSGELKSARQVFLLSGFLLRCLSILGYTVQLKSCLHCKERVMPLSYRWHTAKGGLICSDCIQREPNEWNDAKTVDESVIKLLRFAKEASYADLQRLHLRADVVRVMIQFVQDIIHFHLPNAMERPFWEAVLHDSELELLPRSV